MISSGSRRTSGRAVPGAGVWLAGACAGLMALAGSAQASEVPVGQVSLLIGEARVVHKNGTREPLRRGAAILIGDRIETSANGHVHVRFIDNAAVSVRPDSVLEVQAYRYEADHPQLNEVRLNMEHGTSRSISGQATAIDKNRFRLNTPIAAIGVRGTDFVVQANDLGTRATVAEGAIVVGALGAQCSAAGLGPCTGGQTSLLAAEMGRVMVEMRRGEQVARLVPVSGTTLAADVSTMEERVAAQRAAESAARTAGLLAAEHYRDNDRAAASLITIVTASAPNSPAASNAALAWGRYSFSPGFNDNITQPFVNASAGREPTIGSDDATLFRSTTLGNNAFAGQDTRVVEFRLSRAQATFETGTRVEAANVDGGVLTLDFSKRTFGTALALSSATGGKVELRVAGDVTADGKFSVRDLDPRQYVGGAFSLDGKEAGYLFERGTGGGLFRGKTLWGR